MNTNRINLLLLLLLLLVPIVAINLSSYFLFQIDFSTRETNFLQDGEQNAELLADEADFNYQLSNRFHKFVELLSSDINLPQTTNSLLSNRLEQRNNSIFSQPFPDYELFVFQKESSTSLAEMLYSHGDIKGRKKSLCRAFEYLYSKYLNPSQNANETFAKKLISKNTNPETIATELKGLVTYGNADGQPFWFIWDYVTADNGMVYGCILSCFQDPKYQEYGRILALLDLAKEGKYTGAFIPLYKEYGKPLIPENLQKSELFKRFTQSLTITKEENLDKWFKEDLPQGQKIGKYTEFTALALGSTHIAITLRKSLEEYKQPAWLISLNLAVLIAIILILYLGLAFNKWPLIKLTTRFTLCYLLVAFLPLCLLAVTSHGYLNQYKQNLINETGRELQRTIQSFDARKTSLKNTYTNVFASAIKDERFISLLRDTTSKLTYEERSKLAAQRIIDIFENPNTNNLSLIGARVIDVNGRGDFVSSDSKKKLKINPVIEDSFFTNNKLLEGLLIREKEDGPSELNQNKGLIKYSMVGGETFNSVERHFSIPVLRKNGDLNSFYLIDTVKIDKKPKYLHYIVWDDLHYDKKILQECFDKAILKNRDYTFMSFRNKGTNVESITLPPRGAKKENIIQAQKLARLAKDAKEAHFTLDEESKTLFISVPSQSFIDCIIIGWVDLDSIENSLPVNFRQFTLIFLGIISIVILLLSSLRSMRVFLKPVSSLKSALDSVSAKNLNIELKHRNQDELGQLANEFSSMIEDLKERERLSKLISDQAIEALTTNPEDLLDKTQTFDAVALVSDIRNFTGISEDNDPLVITQMLNEHFAEMSKIISDNGGLIYKFIGDAIEAVFPEKENLEDSAVKRAFKAGCQMIVALGSINLRRQKKNLFKYKIGVGLCHGTLHSGSIGSFDTRLDYAILGNPLKKAALLESWSKENPDFPLVIDEYIANKLEAMGYAINAAQGNNNTKAYHFNPKENQSKLELDILKDWKQEEIKETNEKEETKRVFNLEYTNIIFDKICNLSISGLFTVCLCLVLILGINVVYSTNNEKLKAELTDNANRLIEQINCENALQTVFGQLCQDISYNIKKNKDYKPVGLDYYFYKPKNKSSEALETTKGFSQKATRDMNIFLNAFHQRLDSQSIDELRKPFVVNVDSGSLKARFFKQPGRGRIDGEEYFLETDELREDKTNNFLGYIIYGFKVDEMLAKSSFYISKLPDTDLLLAIRDEFDWHFSEAFSESEKAHLLANYGKEDELKEIGYIKKDLILNGKSLEIFIISKELIRHYKPILIYNNWFLLLALAIIVSSLILTHKAKFSSHSISRKLITDTLLVGILPVITVLFVSYLYINEDYHAKKSERRFELQKYMEKTEKKESYFRPYCWSAFKKLAKSSDISYRVKNIDLLSSEFEKKQKFQELQTYVKRKYTQEILSTDITHFGFNEIDIISNGGWGITINESERIKDEKNSLSNFGQTLASASRLFYFKGTEDNEEINRKNIGKSAGNEIVTSTIIEAFGSVFGNNVVHQLFNNLGIPLYISYGYTTSGVCIEPIPNCISPDYIVIGLVYFHNQCLSKLCQERNLQRLFKQEYNIHKKNDYKYLYYAINTDIGFALSNENHPDLDKALINASTWVDTSDIPVSKNIDLNGKYYLEARRGTYNGDNVLIGLTADYPVKESVKGNIPKFALGLVLSVILMWFISKSVCNDMLAPIRVLTSGAKAVARGDFSFRTKYERNDEMGDLCRSFDQMLKGLEEKQLMNRMVSQTALNESSLASKKIESVLLYISVPQFESIRKENSIYALFQKLRSQTATIAKLVIDSGGDIDKIMGEKLLISFPTNNKPIKEVVSKAYKVALSIESHPGLEFKVAIGVNLGKVISGYLGVGNKCDFTIIGDAVNTTARIASVAEELPNKALLVSEDTYKVIKESFALEYFGQVDLKGKSTALKLYRLI